MAAAFKRKLIGQEDEAGLPVEGGRPPRDYGAHIRPRALDPIREQLERGDVGKISRVELGVRKRSRPWSGTVIARQTPSSAEAYSVRAFTTGMAMQSTWTCNCCWLRAHFELMASPTASRGNAWPRRASTRLLAAQATANTGGASGASICGSSMPVMRRVGMASIWAMPIRSFRTATPWSTPPSRSTRSQGFGPNPASKWGTHSPWTIRHSAFGSARAGALNADRQKVRPSATLAMCRTLRPVRFAARGAPGSTSAAGQRPVFKRQPPGPIR